SPIIKAARAGAYVLAPPAARRYDLATEYMQQAAREHPTMMRVRSFLAKVYVARRMYREAIPLLEHGDPHFLGDLGFAYARIGENEKAKRILASVDQIEPDESCIRAQVHLGWLNFERASDYLDRAYVDRGHCMTDLYVDPMYDEVRSQPRFQQLLKRMNLP